MSLIVNLEHATDGYMVLFNVASHSGSLISTYYLETTRSYYFYY